MMVYLLPVLAVIIGFLIAVFLKPASSTGFRLLLSFSGAFLLAVTVFELLPKVYALEDEPVGLFIMAGLLLQIFLEFLSKGAEHGHIHHQETGKFPLLLLLSLSLHSLLEGFPLHKSDELMHGVVIHKIPVAAILSLFLLNAGINQAKIVLFLLVFALMTPLGSWLNQSLDLLIRYEVYLYSIVIGIFLHVSTTILFEASKNHTFNASKLAVIVLGMGLAYFL